MYTPRHLYLNKTVHQTHRLKLIAEYTHPDGSVKSRLWECSNCKLRLLEDLQIGEAVDSDLREPCTLLPRWVLKEMVQSGEIQGWLDSVNTLVNTMKEKNDSV